MRRALQATGADTGSLNHLPPSEDEPFAVMNVFLDNFPRHALEKAITELEKDVSLEESLSGDTAPLTWDMIETLHRGGMTIGSHTKSHLLLSSESPEIVRRELVESKRILEAHLKASVRHFAYPFGDRVSFRRQHAGMAEEAGFTSAVTAIPGVVETEGLTSLHALPRIAWDGRRRSLRVMRVMLSGVAFPRARRQSSAG